MTPREICVEERAAAKAAHARHDTDCGSSEVQIALFTARIKHITDHVISNPKDHASRRGLLALVSKRRRLINYLHSRDAAKAEKLTNDLGIRFRFKSAMRDAKSLRCRTGILSLSRCCIGLESVCKRSPIFRWTPVRFTRLT